jgi:hypothetical protein
MILEFMMNERIKELALAAFRPINDITTEGVADFHTFKQPWFQLYNKAFAELIVSKCIELMDENYRGDMYTGDVFASEYNNCINEQVQALEDYFGGNK